MGRISKQVFSYTLRLNPATTKKGPSHHYTKYILQSKTKFCSKWPSDHYPKCFNYLKLQFQTIHLLTPTGVLHCRILKSNTASKRGIFFLLFFFQCINFSAPCSDSMLDKWDTSAWHGLLQTNSYKRVLSSLHWLFCINLHYSRK